MLTPHLSPLGRFQEIRREMDRLLGGMGSGPVAGHPALNVFEEADTFVIEAELPGVRSDDLEVQVAGQEVTIKGSRRSTPTDDQKVYRCERAAGTFSRVVELPVAVNAEQVEATLRNGVLTLRLPKSADSMPRRIAVQGN